MKILLTGATGTLGSTILEKLVSSGTKHQIYCLVRNQRSASAESRLKNFAGKVIVVSGDVTKALCGISQADIAAIKSPDVVLHCAASIDFGLSKAVETADINVNGTRNVLELAVLVGAKAFHHVSTAYVANGAAYFSENDLYANQKFRNPYEETKFRGEEIVRLLCAKSALPYTIYRPSVIVGNSVSGKITSFEGYYGFFKYLVAIRDKARKQAKDGLNSNLARMVQGEKVILPIVIKCSFASTLNLVPIDWVVDAICFFLNRKAENKVYHLTSENPPCVKWVIEETLKNIGIECRVHEAADTSKPYKTKIAEILQKGFESTENLYWPYITHGPIFSVKHLKGDMGKCYKICPAIDGPMLKKLVFYAEKEKWGRKTEELLS